MEKNLPSVVITAETDVILQKKKVWAEVGLTVHNANLNLEAKANAIKAKLANIPTTIEEIAGAEANLKVINAELGVLEAERKGVTSKFDKVSQSLMEHEKSVKLAIPAYQTAVLNLKRERERLQNAEKQRQENEKAAKEAAMKFFIDKLKAFQDFVAKKCQDAYEFALSHPKTKKNIEESKIASYIKQLKDKITEKDFEVTKPDAITQENFDGARAYVQFPQPSEFVTYFQKEMDKKFEFYSVAIKNKEAAIKAQQEAEAKAAAEREKETANRNVAATLELTAISSDAVIDDGIKDLKKKYVLDVEDTEKMALLIITAFVTNFAQVKDGVRVKSYSNLTVKQMGDALAWYKNKENAFEFGDLKFKVEEKL